MTKFTKERIEQFIKNPLEHGLTRGEQMEMARQMLAVLEQEPVAYYFPGGERETEQVSLPNDLDDEQKANCIPLYAAPHLPQPAVVVPSIKPDWMNNEFNAGWNACRAAMLQGAEPVRGWIPCSERMPEKYDFDIWVFSPTSGVSDGVQWDGNVFTDDEYQFMVNDATHWMRKAYPAAPQQEDL
ncbi:hypothetical protein LEADMM068B1_18460 [Leclercia adecarboxylata]|uniref:DUF551 domain-containing protein n=1 Tax=Leclercia adecarboxylata TaxID=83655 RepID=UPI003B240DC6